MQTNLATVRNGAQARSENHKSGTGIGQKNTDPEESLIMSTLNVNNPILINED
jgi:hypothetical protein